MKSPRYPLAPLATQRRHEATDRAREAAAAGDAAAEAEAALKRATREALEAEVLRGAARRDAEVALATGPLRAADLARAAEWDQRLGEELEARRLEAEALAARAAAARAVDGAASRALGEAYAKERAVRTHEERFERQARTQAEATEEAAAAEVHAHAAARTGKPRP